MSRLSLWFWVVVYSGILAITEFLDPMVCGLVIVISGSALGLHWWANREEEYQDRFR